MILDYSIRLLVSLLYGFILGFERRKQQNPVGIRTLVLISISCCLLSMLSVHMANLGPQTGDPARIASTTVTGIGFIGGGVILKQGLNIRGLTTAAVIFFTAAIGLCCGAGFYIPVAIAFFITIGILISMSKFEKRVFPVTKTKHILLIISGNNFYQQQIISTLKECGIFINDINYEYNSETNQSSLSLIVKTPHKLNIQELAAKLSENENVISFKIGEQ